MRFRLGLVLGFGSGYYLGARAGRARYEQLNRVLAKAKRSDVYETATEKAKTLVDEGVDRAKEFVEEHRGADGHGSAEPVASNGDTVANPSPGPPPAGSLSDQEPPPVPPVVPPPIVPPPP